MWNERVGGGMLYMSEVRGGYDTNMITLSIIWV
jgi:hypothetical protein